MIRLAAKRQGQWRKMACPSQKFGQVHRLDATRYSADGIGVSGYTTRQRAPQFAFKPGREAIQKHRVGLDLLQ